jgi:hypothetical protein
MSNALLRRAVVPALCVSLISIAARAAAAPPASPAIELDEAAGIFELVNLGPTVVSAIGKMDKATRESILRVYVVGSLADPPPIGGRLVLGVDVVRFIPSHPLEPGLRYRASAKVPGVGGSKPRLVSNEFVILREAPVAATVVSQVYPSADRLPENLLKFYIHFSASMSRGEAYRHIHLLDDSGKSVEGAFLELGEELWDRQHKRFTLLCDPGRVKRGLKPREELGPVLEAGRSYTLVIDADWRDAKGGELAQSTRKAFQVAAPITSAVDPARWKLTAPRAGGRAPLTVKFDRPMDRALLERVLWVDSGSDEKVPSEIDGEIDVDEQETCWRFVPKEAWQAGDYRLVAQTTLEDLSGNAIGRAFEVDEFPAVAETIKTATVSMPFAVAPPDRP